MDVEVRSKPGEAGFSLIEALIAIAILLFIALRMIPLFSRSILNNSAGSDHTVASTFAKDELEGLQDAAFGSSALLIDDTEVLRLTTDFWLPGTASVGDETWVPTPLPTGIKSRWTRTTQVTQYSINAYDDWILEDDERKPGNAEPIEVHFKVIEVRLDNDKEASSGLLPGPSLVYRMIKPF